MINKKVMLLFSTVVFTLYLTFGILGIPRINEIGEFNELIIGYYIIGCLFIFILSFVFYKDIFSNLKDIFKNFGSISYNIFKYSLLMIVGYFLIKLFFSIFFGSNNNITQSSEDVINAFKQFPLYIVFVILIYTPFVEEIIFRKSFSYIFKNNILYIILSSIMFGLLHVIGDGNANNIGDFFLLLIPYTYFGIVLSISYLKTKNIFVPIICHLLYSTILILLLFAI